MNIQNQHCFSINTSMGLSLCQVTTEQADGEQVGRFGIGFWPSLYLKYVKNGQKVCRYEIIGE